MTEEQEQKVIRSLKAGKLQGGGQTFNTLSNVAEIDWAWKHELSSFLQKLQRRGKASYHSVNKVWVWNEDVNVNDFN